MSETVTFERFVFHTASEIGVTLANSAIQAVQKYSGTRKNPFALINEEDFEVVNGNDFTGTASSITDTLVAGVRQEVAEFAEQVVTDDEGGVDADEVASYTEALLEGLAEVVVEWVTAALFCKAMGRNDLIPHENLLASAVTGVFVAEVNVEDDDEDDDEESAPEVEDDEDDYQ